MTKQQIVELTGRSVYAIWLQVAIQRFNPLDPEAAFVEATNFIEELLEQEPDL